MVAGLFLLAGCKLTRFAVPLPDGRIARASDFRVFTTTKAEIECTLDTNGVVTIRIKVASKGDAAMAEAIAAGAAKGAIQGMKP